MKLDIGSGPYPAEGYIHLDIIARKDVEVIGVGQYLPFKSNTFESVRASMVLEHLSIPDGILMIKDAFRILKVGGSLEITIVNMKYAMHVWKHESVEDRLSLEMQKIFVGDRTSEGQYHYSIHDDETVAYLLTKCGFTNIVMRARGARDITLIGLKGSAI